MMISSTFFLTFRNLLKTNFHVKLRYFKVMVILNSVVFVFNLIFAHQEYSTIKCHALIHHPKMEVLNESIAM